MQGLESSSISKIKDQGGQHTNSNSNYRHEYDSLPTNVIQKLSTTNVIDSLLLNRFSF